MAEWLSGAINAQQEGKKQDADKLYSRNLEAQRNKEAIDRFLLEQKTGNERFGVEQDFRNRQQAFNEGQAKDTQALAIAPTLQANTDLTGQLDPKIEEALRRLGQLKQINTLPSTQSVGDGSGGMTSTESAPTPQLMRPSTPGEDIANQGLKLKNQEFDLQKRLTEKSLAEPGVKEMAILNAQLALKGGEALAAFQNGLAKQVSPAQALTLMERIMASKDYGENQETYTDFIKTLMTLAKLPPGAMGTGGGPDPLKAPPPPATAAPGGPGITDWIKNFLSGAKGAPTPPVTPQESVHTPFIPPSVGKATTPYSQQCPPGKTFNRDIGRCM